MLLNTLSPVARFVANHSVPVLRDDAASGRLLVREVGTRTAPDGTVTPYEADVWIPATFEAARRWLNY